MPKSTLLDCTSKLYKNSFLGLSINYKHKLPFFHLVFLGAAKHASKSDGVKTKNQKKKLLKPNISSAYSTGLKL